MPAIGIAVRMGFSPRGTSATKVGLLYASIAALKALRYPKATFSLRFPTPLTASRPLGSGRPPSSPPLAQSSGKELLPANFLLQPVSSRGGRVPAQSLHAEACHIPAPPERIQTAPAPLLQSCPTREKCDAAHLGDEYESTPIPAPCH